MHLSFRYFSFPLRFSLAVSFFLPLFLPLLPLPLDGIGGKGKMLSKQ